MSEINEYRFEILKRLENNGFLRPEDFESAKEFNYACEVALTMLEEGLLRTNQNTPYIPNMEGTEEKYTIMGEFMLSENALNAIRADSYEHYKKSQPKIRIWNLDRRLMVWGIVIALISALLALL